VSKSHRISGVLGWHQKYAPFSWTKPLGGVNGPVKVTKFVKGEPVAVEEVPARPADAPDRTASLFITAPSGLWHESSYQVLKSMKDRSRRK